MSRTPSTNFPPTTPKSHILNIMDFNTKHMYGQQRQRVEDRLIRVKTTFQPNLRTATVTRFGSDRCDRCTCDAAASESRPSPMQKLPKYRELVQHAILDGPREKYGGSQPPLTSHDYGWLPADMYTSKYDQFDRCLLDHRLRNQNINA